VKWGTGKTAGPQFRFLGGCGTPYGPRGRPWLAKKKATPGNLFDRVPGIQAASHRQAMANRADRQRGRVHHPRGIGERGDAFGVQAPPQHLVQQLMYPLMGECLARTHGRLRESKETAA
jgi:hypothetical protein